MSSIQYFENHIWKFCAKPKEVDPIKSISLRQISVSIALKYIINNSVLKWIGSGHRWLQHFLFLLKISLTAISFYWRNDTPTNTRHLTSSSQNQFVPQTVSPLPCPLYITVCLLFQRTHFFHWLPWQMPHQFCQRFDYMYIIELRKPMESCHVNVELLPDYLYCTGWSFFQRK